VSLLDFFKTIFSTDSQAPSDYQQHHHPLFRDKERSFLRKLRKQLKLFELCIRNFEQTYIAMIKELHEKIFKLNVEMTHQASIVMRKREVAMN
jgi:hypothetical protein